ncbi:MAG: dTDP-glucose 4,6-dehydratase [Candidatus Eisenbacteria sp.]|nr:dTDP-glucose 4,6-dehydratase [Candidatus Eisenbacteria bacterium]
MDRRQKLEGGHYLVTGGAGFIGSNFVKHIRSRFPQARVTVLDKLTYAGNPANLAEFEGKEGFTFVRGDICDHDLVRELFARGFDWVLNFAAETHVDRSIGDPGQFVQTDMYGVYNLLEAMRDLGGVERFIQISTDEVYGEVLENASPEDAPLMPRNPYAASKAGGDRLAYSYHATYGLPIVITRCSNNYGPYQYPEKLLPLFATNAIENKKLPVYGSGKNTRDWIHVLDHVRALVVLLETDGADGEVFNIGAYNERDVLTIADLILKTLGKPASLLAHVVDRPGHDRRYAVDWTKIEQRTPWRPEVSLEEGLAETVRWYEDNADWWRPLKSGEFWEFYKQNYKFLDQHPSSQES